MDRFEWERLNIPSFVETEGERPVSSRMEGNTLPAGGARRPAVADPMRAGRAPTPAPREQSESQTAPSADHLFELGRALFQAGNLKDSAERLQKAAPLLAAAEDLSAYIECHNMLVGALNELKEESRLQEVQKEFEETCRKRKVQKMPRVLLVDGFCFGLARQNGDRAEARFNEALETALENQADSIKSGDICGELKSKADIMCCLCAFAYYHFATCEPKKCREKLARLQELLAWLLNVKEEILVKRSQTDNAQMQQHFQKLLRVIEGEGFRIKQMRLTSNILRALTEKDHKKALKILWDSYEKANGLNEKHLIPYIFLYMAYNHFCLREREQANLFLSLAKKAASAQSFKRLLERIEQFESQVSDSSINDTAVYDMVFSQSDHSLTVKGKGCVRFNGRMILADLMSLFIENQGKPQSKVRLARRIWKESYAPQTHDNKIYVTVKRLRSCIEPDGRARYICRSREGWYLDGKVKVLVK